MDQIVSLFQSDLAEACGDSPGLLCRWVYELTDSTGLADFTDWLVAKPLKVALILLIAYVVNRVIRRAIRRMVENMAEERRQRAEERRRQEIEDGRFAALRARAAEKAQFLKMQGERSEQRAYALGSVLRSITALVIYSMALIMALAEFGISLGPLIAGAGVIGIALGFGAQSLVRDFLSGIFMLVEDQFGVGDVIDVGEASGVVEEVKLRTTRIRDVNGTVWHIPNGEIRRIGNKSQQWARAVLDIGVAYDTDLGHAAEVIKRVADEVWHENLEHATVLEEPEIWGVESFGDSSIAIRLVVKVEPGEQWATAREIRRRLKAAFDEEGIEIPFPQRTVWMPGASAPGENVVPQQSDFEAAGGKEEG
jgi:small-conductance mechanosensitive channel